MKLKLGRPDYAYKHQGAGDVNLCIRGRNGKDIALTTIDMPLMRTKRESQDNLRGIPAFVSYDKEKSRLWFHPAPQAEYEIDQSRELAGGS
jgi:hypothetical protein